MLKRCGTQSVEQLFPNSW